MRMVCAGPCGRPCSPASTVRQCSSPPPRHQAPPSSPPAPCGQLKCSLCLQCPRRIIQAHLTHHFLLYFLLGAGRPAPAPTCRHSRHPEHRGQTPHGPPLPPQPDAPPPVLLGCCLPPPDAARRFSSLKTQPPAARCVETSSSLCPAAYRLSGAGHVSVYTLGLWRGCRRFRGRGRNVRFCILPSTCLRTLGARPPTDVCGRNREAGGDAQSWLRVFRHMHTARAMLNEAWTLSGVGFFLGGRRI